MEEEVGGGFLRADDAEVFAVGLGIGGVALDAVDEAGGELPAVGQRDDGHGRGGGGGGRRG
jgi:hypothetical protein